MLTSELIRPRLRIHGSNLRIEMVNEQDPSLQQKAHDLICLFNRHRSQSQAAWEEAVRAYEGTNVDYVFIRGLAKVLTDAAIFKPLPTPLPPTTLREQYFHMARFSKNRIYFVPLLARKYSAMISRCARTLPGRT